MDLLDQKIVLALIENSRYPNALLAKQFKVSEPLIKYRIERLEKEGIIQKYITSIMQNAIGVLRYIVVYLRIKKTHNYEKSAILKYLEAHPLITKLFECDGAWNIGFEVSSALQLEIKPILDEVQRLSNGHLEDLRMFNICLSNFLKRQPFGENIKNVEAIIKTRLRKDASFQKDIIFSKNVQFHGVARLDNIDLSILSLLGHNARISLYQLANHAGCNVQTAKKRISGLIRKGIIKNFTIFVNYEPIGYKKVIVLFSVLAEKGKQDDIIKFIEHNFSSLYMVFGYLGYWNVGFVAYTKEVEEIETMIEQVLAKFGDAISDYTKLMIIRDIKYDSYNINLKKIYGDALNLLEPR